MSPEFGRTGIKSLGSIDFFLAPNKWGIELFTRDGNRIEEHYRRFLPKGRYHSWVQDGTFVDWVLIDFRTNRPSSFRQVAPTPYAYQGGLIHISDFAMLPSGFTKVKIYNHVLELIVKFPLLG